MVWREGFLSRGTTTFMLGELEPDLMWFYAIWGGPPAGAGPRRPFFFIFADRLLAKIGQHGRELFGKIDQKSNNLDKKRHSLTG